MVLKIILLALLLLVLVSSAECRGGGGGRGGRGSHRSGVQRGYATMHGRNKQFAPGQSSHDLYASVNNQKKKKKRVVPLPHYYPRGNSTDLSQMYKSGAASASASQSSDSSNTVRRKNKQ